MFFFNGKEDMGLDACLNLLDLSTDATIDDANQAYTYYHRMIDLFHRDQDTDRGDRQEDLELLACAYEKAVSYLSDAHAATGQAATPGAPKTDGGNAQPSADLHFTINFSAPGDASSADNEPHLAAEPHSGTVENAIAIISRRLREAESALENAREAVEAATAAVDDANRRLEKSRHARMDAMVAAKSAKSRAMLLDIEAQRATEEAIAIAEKVRERVKTARRAVKAAKLEADKAQDQVQRFVREEETAAAEAVCAQDRLEKAKQRLTDLTHAIVEARGQLRMFEEYGAQSRPLTASATAGPADVRQQLMSDLLEIENSITTRKRRAASPTPGKPAIVRALERDGEERRQHERLTYPVAQRPMFSFEGRAIPVLDLSQTGMRLEPDAMVGKSHLVRGAIVFDNLPTMNVTGRLVRRNERGLGLRLVTRIGTHILDQERKRINA